MGKITFKNKQITEAVFTSFREISKNKIPVSVSWELVKIAQELEKVGEAINNQRKIFFDSYAEKDENGNNIPEETKDGKQGFKVKKEYFEKMNEFGELDGTIEFEKIDFAKTKIEEIAPEHLFNLNFIFNL